MKNIVRSYWENFGKSFVFIGVFSILFLILLPIKDAEDKVVAKMQTVEYKGTITEAFRSADGSTNWQVIALEGDSKEFKKLQVSETNFQNYKVGSSVDYVEQNNYITGAIIYIWAGLCIFGVLNIGFFWHFFYRWTIEHGDALRHAKETQLYRRRK